MKKVSYSASLGTLSDSNSYKISFSTESSQLLTGLTLEYVDTNVRGELPCGLLDNELALTSEYYISQFSDCLIGSLPGFVE